MVNYKLSIELVPSTSWYNNVRSQVSKQIWDIIRKKCYQNAYYKCEICGNNGKNQGANHPVDCHEIWHYDDITHVQKLIGFVDLCPNCHLVKHPGFNAIHLRMQWRDKFKKDAAFDAMIKAFCTQYVKDHPEYDIMNPSFKLDKPIKKDEKAHN